MSNVDIKYTELVAESLPDFIIIVENDRERILPLDFDIKEKALYEPIELESLLDRSCQAENIEPDAKNTITVVQKGPDYYTISGFDDIVLSSLLVSLSYIRIIYARMRKKPCLVFASERLIFREISLDQGDIDALFALYESLASNPFVEPLYDREREIEFNKNYIENMYRFFQYGLWLLFDKESGRLIGRAGIENRLIDQQTKQEIAYLIDSSCQGQGYGSEAVDAILAYACDELGIEEIYACIDKDNMPSIKLAEKKGFTREANSDIGLILYKKELD